MSISHQPRQHTISRPVEVSGRGYWSGEVIHVEFRPAKAGAGIEFVRRDLAARPRVAASVANRVEVPRRTNLAAGAARVDMVEHVLAALAGLQIDNCEVWVTGAEMPAGDGSSEAFVRALLQAGIEEQADRAPRLIVRDTVRVGDDRAWVEAAPLPHSGLELQYDLDFGHDTAIGGQCFTMRVDPDSFCTELAPARTFLQEAEALALRAQGFGLHATYQDLLVFGPQGPIQNELRFENECVRHKMLDMIGDLALSRCRLEGRFRAFRSGHRLNAELVAALLALHQGRRASA